MLMGPLLGSVLFKAGGFQLPFYTVGVLLLVLMVVIQFMVTADLIPAYSLQAQSTGEPGEVR